MIQSKYTCLNEKKILLRQDVAAAKWTCKLTQRPHHEPLTEI